MSILKIKPVEAPRQMAHGVGILLAETSSFIRAVEARTRYEVNGKSFTVAVLDTGLRVTHVDFAERVVATYNCSSLMVPIPTDVTDRNGHGTNVGGIIVANGNHIGIAPEANIIPIKVLNDDGSGDFGAIDRALQWVIDNQAKYRITVVNMSLGDSGNYLRESDIIGTDPILNAITLKINALHEKNVAVIIAAGNGFFSNNSKQGMSFPAIVHSSISVGAVYDADEGPFTYGDGSKAKSTGAGRITPFSQRLHPTKNKTDYTDIFAPGAPITSSGISNDRGTSVQHGTSQASPVTAGVILLMQELYWKISKILNPAIPDNDMRHLPSISFLVKCLRSGGVVIKDGDDEDDNVIHTKLNYIRLDAYNALRQVRKHFVKVLSEKPISELV